MLAIIIIGGLSIHIDERDEQWLDALQRRFSICGDYRCYSHGIMEVSQGVRSNIALMLVSVCGSALGLYHAHCPIRLGCLDCGSVR